MENKKKAIVVYDRSVLPINTTLKEVIDKYRQHGIIDWCSTASGNVSGKNLDGSHAPKLIDADSFEDIKASDEIKIIDLGK